MREHSYQPFTRRDGSQACAKCHAPPDHPSHSQRPRMMLGAGGYSFALARRAIEHKYMGGGHAGCGGCVWALEFVDEPREAQFLFYEFRTDCDGDRHRCLVVDSLEHLLSGWERIYTLTHISGPPWSEWSTEPPWFYRPATPIADNRT